MKKDKADNQKSNQPIVSFVICEHNTDPEFFKEAILSVIEQTYSNLEIIIVDDCTHTISFDDDFLHDERIKIIKNERNIGLAGSRNVGINASHGKYIAIMDTDDICEPNRIATQVDYMEKHPDVVCAGSYIELFGKRNGKEKYIIDDNDYYRCCLLFGNSPTISNPSSIIRKEVLKRNNISYDESLKTAEDYMMWVTLSQYGKLRIIKKVLLNYRIRSGQMSEIYRREDLDDNHWKIVKKQLNCLGINEISKEKEMFIRTNFKSETINPYDYYLWLQELISANEKTHFFNQRSFKKRIKEQWKQKVYNIRSFTVFKSLFKKLSFTKKIQVLWFEFVRPFNKVLYLFHGLWKNI